MAINFPDSPTSGDTHTVGDKTWTWNGTSWDVVVSTPISNQIIDADGDTRIHVEESPDEDYIRFDTAGTERMTIGPTGDVTVVNDLSVTGTISGGSTSFPTSLDSGTMPAIEALQAKVGADSSAVTSSHDYILSNGVLPTLNVDSGVLVVDDTNNRVGVNDATPSYALDVTGDINATGDLRIAGNAIGEWTTFTPTFNNVTLGASGTVTGRYARVKDLVFYAVAFDLAGTGSVTGQIGLVPPVGNTDASTTFPVSHQAWCRPTGGTIYHGMGFANVTSILYYAYALTGSYQTAAGMTGSIPIAWNSDGIFYSQGWFALA